MTTQAQIGPLDIDSWVVDWTAWLARKTAEESTPVTIATSSWTATGGLVVLDDPPATVFDNDQQTKCWWDAGACAEHDVVTLVNSIITSAGHERSWTVVMTVVRR